MPWVLLFLAGLSEVVWAVLSKYSNGFRNFWPSAGTIGFNVLSVVLLMLALKRLPLGTAYAIWTGIGVVGTTLYGMWRLGEARDLPRLLCIGLILAGLLGLKAMTRTAE
jgi:quaternary ammonium compound-resistance protein SugE